MPQASSLGYTANSLQIKSKECSSIRKKEDNKGGMTTLACCSSDYVHIGTARPEVSTTHLLPPTVSLCHVESVDIWGLFHVCLLHLPS